MSGRRGTSQTGGAGPGQMLSSPGRHASSSSQGSGLGLGLGSGSMMLKVKVFEAAIRLFDLVDSIKKMSNNTSISDQQYAQEPHVLKLYTVLQEISVDDTVLQSSVSSLLSVDISTSIASYRSSSSSISSSSGMRAINSSIQRLGGGLVSPKPVAGPGDFNLLVGFETDVKYTAINSTMRVTLCQFDSNVDVMVSNSSDINIIDSSCSTSSPPHSPTSPYSSLSPKIVAGLSLGSIDIPVSRLSEAKSISQWYQLTNRQTNEGTPHSLRIEVSFVDEIVRGDFSSNSNCTKKSNNSNSNAENRNYDSDGSNSERSNAHVEDGSDNSSLSISAKNIVPVNMNKDNVLPVGIIDYVVIVGPHDITPIISLPMPLSSPGDSSWCKYTVSIPLLEGSSGSLNVIYDTITSFSDVSILDRFPSTDFPDCPLPDKIDWFVCPGGCQVVTKTILITNWEEISSTHDIYSYSKLCSQTLRPYHCVSSLILAGGQEESELFGVNLRFYSLVKVNWSLGDASKAGNAERILPQNRPKLWWELGETGDPSAVDSRSEGSNAGIDFVIHHQSNSDDTNKLVAYATFTWVEVDLLLLSEYSFIESLTSIINNLYTFSILPELIDRERKGIDAFKANFEKECSSEGSSKSNLSLRAPIRIALDSTKTSSFLGCEKILLFLLGECPLPVSKLINIQIQFPKRSDKHNYNNDNISGCSMGDNKTFVEDVAESAAIVSFPCRGISKDSPLKVCPYDLLSLLTLVGPRLLIDLFMVVISEGRLLIHSKDINLLPQICQSLKVLVNPLPWSIVYLPIVPSFIMEVIEAPVPYLLGVSTSALESYISSTSRTSSSDPFSSSFDFSVNSFDFKLQDRLEGVTIFNIDNQTLHRPSKSRYNSNNNYNSSGHHSASSSHGHTSSNSRTIKFPETVDRWLMLSLQHLIDHHEDYAKSASLYFPGEDLKMGADKGNIGTASSNSSMGHKNYSTEYCKVKSGDLSKITKKSSFLAGVTIQILFLDVFSYFLKDLPDCILPAGQGMAIFNKAMFMNESVMKTSFLSPKSSNRVTPDTGTSASGSNTEFGDNSQEMPSGSATKKIDAKENSYSDDIVDVYRFLHFLTDLNSFHRMVDGFNFQTSSSSNSNDKDSFFPKCLSALNGQKINMNFLNYGQSKADSSDKCSAPLGKSIAFMKEIYNNFQINSSAKSSSEDQDDMSNIKILGHFKFIYKLKPRSHYDSSMRTFEGQQNDSGSGWGVSRHIDSLIAELPHFLLMGLDYIFVDNFMRNIRYPSKIESGTANKDGGENYCNDEHISMSQVEFLSLMVWLRFSIYINETDLFPGVSSMEESDYSLLIKFHNLDRVLPNSSGLNVANISESSCFEKETLTEDGPVDLNDDLMMSVDGEFRNNTIFADSGDYQVVDGSKEKTSSVYDGSNEEEIANDTPKKSSKKSSNSSPDHQVSNTLSPMSLNPASTSTSSTLNADLSLNDDIVIQAVTRRRRSSLYVNTSPVPPAATAMAGSSKANTPQKNTLAKIIHGSSSHSPHNSNSSTHNNLGIDSIDIEEDELSHHEKSSHSSYYSYHGKSSHAKSSLAAGSESSKHTDDGCVDFEGSHSHLVSIPSTHKEESESHIGPVKPIFTFDRAIVLNSNFSDSDQFTVEMLVDKFSEDTSSIKSRFRLANPDGREGQDEPASPIEERQTFILNESRNTNAGGAQPAAGNISVGKWGHWLGDAVGPNEICVLDFLQFNISGKKDLVSGDEFEAMSNSFKASLTNNEGCRKFLIQILLQRFFDSADSEDRTKTMIFPLHSSAFDALSNLYIDVLTICSESCDYFTAYQLLLSGDIYYHLIQHGGSDDDECEVEFLNNKIWSHPIFQTVNFWKFIIHSQFDPIQVRELRERFCIMFNNDIDEHLAEHYKGNKHFGSTFDAHLQQWRRYGFDTVPLAKDIVNRDRTDSTASELVRLYNDLVFELLATICRMKVIARILFATSTRVYEFVQSIFAEYEIPVKFYLNNVGKFISTLWNSYFECDDSSPLIRSDSDTSGDAYPPTTWEANLYDRVTCNSFFCLSCSVRQKKTHRSIIEASVVGASSDNDIYVDESEIIQSFADIFCNDSYSSSHTNITNSFESIDLATDDSSEKKPNLSSSSNSSSVWGINLFGNKPAKKK